MTRDEVQALVIDVINEVQEYSGQAIVPISEETVLLRDLDEFDSLRAVETAAIVSERLSSAGRNVDIPVDVFLSDGKTPSSLGYVADSIMRILEAK